MLALMAGRNGGKALAYVKNGEVRRILLARERSLAPTEPVCSVARRIVVTLWLVWTPVERDCGGSEANCGVPRIRKNRTGDSASLGRIRNYTVPLHHQSRISAKEGPRGLADREIPPYQPGIRECESGGPEDASERERCIVHPGAGWGRNETHRE